jgi:hypothetical protein
LTVSLSGIWARVRFSGSILNSYSPFLRREAERQAQQSRDERDCVIDVTTSLREAITNGMMRPLSRRSNLSRKSLPASPSILKKSLTS